MPAGMTPQVQEDRLPYIDFQARNSKKSDAQGNPIFVDEDWVVIHSAGGKDRVDKLVKDWIKQLEQLLDMKRVSPEYVRQVKAAYAAFTEGKELPVTGTVLEALGLTSDQMKMLRELHVRTVEDLSLANEELIQRMGMGGRALKSRAQIYMSTKDGPAAVANQLTALQISNESLKKQVEALEARAVVAESEAQGLRQALVSGGGVPTDLGDPALRLKQAAGKTDDDLVEQSLGG